MNVIVYLILWMLSVLLSLFIGGFLKSYLSKKGENLATHEDLEKLIEQVAAVTRTTKEIEARISGDLWSRQWHLELKKEAALSGIKAVGALNWGLSELLGVFAGTEEVYKDPSRTAEREHAENLRREQLSRFNAALKRFAEDAGAVLIVCGESVRDQFVKAQNVLCNAAIAGTSRVGDVIENHQRIVAAMKVLEELTSAIRKDLEL